MAIEVYSQYSLKMFLVNLGIKARELFLQLISKFKFYLELDSVRRKNNIDARIMSVVKFEQMFSCKINTIPKNVMLLGWSAEASSWFCTPVATEGSQIANDRLPATMDFLKYEVFPKLPDQCFWTMLSFYDGWRERNTYSENFTWVYPEDLTDVQEWRGAPGEIPVLCEDQRWVLCYGSHRGDPSAVLLPEAHYLSQNYYRELFTKVNMHLVPWHEKLTRTIYCAGNHGECTNYFPPLVSERAHPRQYLAQLVENTALPIHLCLGQNIQHSEQLKYKFILDIDGFARTWDAWAWKMYSGSTVLSVDSPWESFFTRFFEPWIHYVPIANDFSDLADKLAWCTQNDATCEIIAQQARQRAEEVYSLDYVTSVFAQQLLKVQRKL